ncbi:uncharacterized protein PGRI_053610 [Penicillium griseofulvum]|uniref:RNase III domain-containing protein n=1 Tax=Penicillium patulum TaxID=5078 RepID=A0A135LC07_PENPA|nr:uncharacterized protein PGRI_053610 [Penicillium griseofulvum]KXG46505.1 hypothetical protein PGRI_053610 [Penicillium griseofulvum]
MVIYLPLPPDREIEVFEDSVLQRTYRFTNRDMTREALQVCGPYSRQGNKVLALAGDALLRQILVDQGRERAKTPEEIQNVITRVASNENLFNRGIAVGLDRFIVKNPGQWGVMAGKNVMATAIEAIIGAVYYDSNKNAHDCERVMAALGLCWPE